MKKIVISTIATLASVVIASDDITPVEVKSAPSAIEKSLLERVHFKSDLRLRYESIERDDDEYTTRYRLRLGANIDLIDNLQFEVGMRSGFANPTSGNQTFRDDEPLSDYFFQSLRFNILGLAYKSGNSTFKVGRQPHMMYRPIESQLV